MVGYYDFKNSICDAWEACHMNGGVRNIAVRSYFWKNGLTMDKCKRVFKATFYDELQRHIQKIKDMPDDKWIIEFIIKSETLSNYVKNIVIKKQCPKCGQYKPLIGGFYFGESRAIQSHCIDCCKEHGERKNGTTGVHRDEDENTSKPMKPIIKTFPDDVIINEAKNRGILTIELALDILRFNGIKGEFYKTGKYTL